MDNKLFLQITSIVRAERLKQEKKWGKQDHPPELWTTIEVEEVGEAAQAGLRHNYTEKYGPRDKQMENLGNLIEEWVQVAAVAFAVIENMATDYPNAPAVFKDLHERTSAFLERIQEADSDHSEGTP